MGRVIKGLFFSVILFYVATAVSSCHNMLSEAKTQTLQMYGSAS